MNDVRVRPFREADAPALAALFHEAVHVIAAEHYSPEQLAAWSPAPADPARWVARAADGRTTLVAVDDADRPLAYGDLEANGHVDHLYCRADRAGTGVTRALYAELETAAREQGIAALHVEASEPARRFFARAGFTTEARRDFAIGSVAIHNFRMTKTLA